MQGQDKIEVFVTFLNCGNYTDDTKRNYVSMLRKFLSEFELQYDKATNEQLAAYISSMPSRASMSQMYSVLKLFYKYVLKRKTLFDFIPFPRSEERLRKLPTHDQLIEAFDIPNTKHKLILYLLYGTGLRVSECANLRWSDIRREEGENPLSLFIRGKGNRDRVVPVSRFVYNLFYTYCKEYKLDSSCADCLVFNVTVRTIQQVVRKAGERIDFKLTPHLLRHACFQHLADKGVQLPYLAQIAGHKSEYTTIKYARLVPQKVKMPV